MATPTKSPLPTESTEMNLRKHTILFVQEVACLQRPWFTAAWAASLHLVWYYLSFNKSSFLSKCCTAGIVIVATDYAVQWYHRRSQRVRALLPPLLPQTIRRENGVNTPSAVPLVMAPRTHAQLSELLDQCCHVAVAVKDQILVWRSQHTDVFSGCLAASCFVLGILFNRFSGAFLLYIVVLLILAVPILERVPQVRALCVQIQPARIAEFLSTHAVVSPHHEEEVRHLEQHLPPVSAIVEPFSSPSLVREQHGEELVKADLAQYFQEEDLIEQLQAARAKRSSERIAAVTDASAADDAVAPENVSLGVSATTTAEPEGLRRRNTAGAQLNETEDDGFSMVNHSEINN